jgi:hypothetical protein
VPKGRYTHGTVTPGSGSNGQPDKSCAILATGRAYRCGELQPPISKTNLNDEQYLEDKKSELDAVEPYFPPAQGRYGAFRIEDVCSFDLETGSLKDGIFHVYACGYQVGREDEPHCAVAETVDELRGGLMSALLDKWEEIAQQHNADWRQKEADRVASLGAKELTKAYKLLLTKEAKKDKPWHRQSPSTVKQLYLEEMERQDLGPGLAMIAYNGSRFDNVEILHSLLADKGVAPRRRWTGRRCTPT